MPGLEDFLTEVDHLWRPPPDAKIRLSVIGSTALMLQADYQRGTKDSDILETIHLTPNIRVRLLDLAGKDTRLHGKHGIYMEILSQGFPFLPQAPRWVDRPELNAKLKHFDFEVLDVVDVVVSKLKRFNPNDEADIGAMIERGLVPHEGLVARFRSAVDWYLMDSRADDLRRYVANLHRVERDHLLVAETDIELPDWI